ncbi:MAG: 4Fe-4S binding protein [Methanobacterium sp.]
MELQDEKCGYCGACISICPNDSLKINEGAAILDSNKCDNCGRCAIICPLGAFMGV